jgi:hypothetical protein
MSVVRSIAWVAIALPSPRCGLALSGTDEQPIELEKQEKVGYSTVIIDAAFIVYYFEAGAIYLAPGQ